MGTRLYIRKRGSNEEFCFGSLYHSTTLDYYSSLGYLVTKHCFTAEFNEFIKEVCEEYEYPTPHSFSDYVNNVADVIFGCSYLEYGEFAVIKKDDFAEFIHKYLEDCNKACNKECLMPPRFFDWLINNCDASFEGQDEELAIPLRIVDWLINNSDATMFELRIGA